MMKPALGGLPPSVGFARDTEGHSAKTEPWRGWYKLARWAKIRAEQLKAFPLCAFCLREGVTKAATICDHVEPHRGDAIKFWRGPFQSLCKPCHDGEKQAAEKGAAPGAW